MLRRLIAEMYTSLVGFFKKKARRRKAYSLRMRELDIVCIIEQYQANEEVLRSKQKKITRRISAVSLEI